MRAAEIQMKALKKRKAQAADLPGNRAPLNKETCDECR